IRVLDYDLVQIEASLLINFMPQVFARLEELATETGALMGVSGAWIEEKDSGVVLYQQALRDEMNVHAIDSKLTAMGKDARGVAISGYVFKDQVKFTKLAYEKTLIYHGRNRNHLWYQATGYRVGQGTTSDEDELFDTLCYGVELGLGE